MYLVVIGVLSIILAFIRPPYLYVEGTPLTLAAVVLATVAPCVGGWFVNRHALRMLERHTADPAIGQYALSKGFLALQTLLAVAHAFVLLTTNWMPLCRQTPLIGEWPAVAGVLAGTPFILSVLLLWLAVYPAERAVRQIAVEVGLYRGRPVHPVWTRAEYVTFNLRHQVLFVLVPMILILLARDVLEASEAPLMRVHPYLPDLLLGAATGAVALVTPALLRHVWSTQRLPDGPLRDRLLFLCRKLRLRCREILVWRSGGMIVNAAVMGVVAPFRYVMITDGMLEQLDDTKIEAVFGHEAGHVKRHHILFFLLLAFISGCWITILSVYTRSAAPATFQILVALGAGVLLVKWAFLFGWISRRFERQADVFGARTLALAGVPCNAPCTIHGHPLGGDPAAAGPARGSQAAEARSAPLDLVNGNRLCASAAHIFGDTLNEVALLNGIPPQAPSWRHSSIASRSRFVQRLAHDPERLRCFERTIVLIKRMILAVAFVSALWAAWELQLWTLVLSAAATAAVVTG